jgi:hypothetical protein
MPISINPLKPRLEDLDTFKDAKIAFSKEKYNLEIERL